jgi:SAM-dependent methyltransferase
VTASAPLSDVQAREAWLDHGFGAEVLAAEQSLVAAKLPGLFGFHLMQLGISRRVSLYDDSVVRHRFRLASEAGNTGCAAVAAPESLPFEADSIDVALLHHALEYSPDPHQLLREAARVVVPHGHMVVIGFNPWSLFGLCSLPGRFLGHPVWRSRLLGVRRVCDWLKLLDFAIDDVQYRVFAPPVDHEGFLRRMRSVDRGAARLGLPGGAVYMVHARKQQGVLTPSRVLRWRAPRFAGVPIATPSTRNPTLH